MKPVVPIHGVPGQNMNGKPTTRKLCHRCSVCDALYENVYSLTRTCESRFEHHETHLHAENQVGRNEGPDGIYRIDMWRR
jgi:hypothetical protein